MDLVLIVSTLAKIVFVLVIILTFAPLLVWAERRQSAMIQDRVGPHRAGITIFGKNITLLGLLHPLADAVKLIWKEDFIPPKADKMLHAMAPIVAFVPAVVTFAVIPFADTLYLDAIDNFVRDLGDGRLCILDPDNNFECSSLAFESARVPMQIASLNVGILFSFAIAGTGVVGAAIAGYASDNKYSLLGGLRAAGQMVSYEVTLGLTLVGAFMVYGTLLVDDMVHWQASHVWGFIAQPLGCILYFTAATAESKRIPFDLPEGESELVGGYFTEYSGMKWGIFFFAEFIEVIVLAALAGALFFGGYDVPFLETHGFDFSMRFGQTILFENAQLYLPHWAVLGAQVTAFIVKLVVLIWFQLMVRWTLPRFRYDQVMSLCWKYILPLSLANIFVTGGLLVAWDGWIRPWLER